MPQNKRKGSSTLPLMPSMETVKQEFRIISWALFKGALGRSIKWQQIIHNKDSCIAWWRAIHTNYKHVCYCFITPVLSSEKMQNPKCRYILFQYTNVYLCAKFGDLNKANDRRKSTSSNLDLFLCRNKIPKRNCNFILTKCFMCVNWSSWSTDCAAKSSKPQFMLWDHRGDQPR